jgi:hypothetical protein
VHSGPLLAGGGGKGGWLQLTDVLPLSTDRHSAVL